MLNAWQSVVIVEHHQTCSVFSVPLALSLFLSFFFSFSCSRAEENPDGTTRGAECIKMRRDICDAETRTVMRRVKCTRISGVRRKRTQADPRIPRRTFVSVRGISRILHSLRTPSRYIKSEVEQARRLLARKRRAYRGNDEASEARPGLMRFR